MILKFEIIASADVDSCPTEYYMFLLYMFLLLFTLLLSAQCNVSNLTKCLNGEVTLCKSKSLEFFLC